MLAVRKICSRQWGWSSLCLPLLLVVLSVYPLQAQESVSLVGAGSTVPQPLFSKWAQEFNKVNRTVQMQYQPLGTSEGLKLISGSKEELGKTDFSAGEVLLTEQELASGQLIQLPAVIIGIVPIYNLPGSPELKFSGDVLAKIFLGHIKMWNAPQIARLNPGVSLPAQPIKVVYRPGGKGSNYVFTDFLSKTSADFRAAIGRSASPKWPVGEPAERSSDMADKVKTLPGSIGYVELQYALKEGIPYALVQNAAGKFVKATEATTIAACQAVESPSWNKFSVSLTNASGADSFPITSFSWLYLRSVSSDLRRRAALVNLLNWIYGGGQQVASLQGYTQLPGQLLDRIKAKVVALN
ncbi:MAG TPA: phosphate ABC transporter substrate-binding protein PstS [Candidatus Angelobacter sp.]